MSVTTELFAHLSVLRLQN